MKTISKYRQIILAIVLDLLFVAFDWWLAGKEIVIQSPGLIRKKMPWPVSDDEWSRRIIEEEVRREFERRIKEKLEEQLENGSETSLAPRRAVFAKVGEGTIGLIKKWARFYGVDEDFALCVAFRESSYNPLAVGDGGRALGLYQFWLSTWRMIRKKMGEDTTDYRMNPNEAAKTACWAFAHGYGYHWTPVRSGACR